MNDRGLSSVVGYVLLIGITLTASGLLIYTGVSMVDSISAQTQNEQAQQSMAQFSSEASLVALGNLNHREISFGNTHNGHLDIREQSGSIDVYVKNNSTTTYLLENKTLGAAVYQQDNTEIAYQGGGVWRKDGTYARMVSPPEYHYQGRTLTFPVIRVAGTDSASGSARMNVERLGTTGTISYQNPISDGEVYVEVQSEYCEGWKAFFETRTGGSVTACTDQTVTAKLVVPKDLNLAFGVATENGIDPPNSQSAEFPDNTNPTANLASIDGLVADKVTAAAGDNDNSVATCVDEDSFTGGCELDGGTYFVNESATLGNDVTLDTEDGDIEIVVNGDFDVTDRSLINTDNATENNVTYYVAGDFELQGSTLKTQSDHAYESDRTRLIVSEGVGEQSNSLADATIHAIIYAPNADISIKGNGNSVIRGAIYANSLTMTGGGNSVVDYDEAALDDFTLSLDTAATAITYLHLSENRIRVSLD